ncbi:hypothetical protein [Streptomyces viridosporus]|uniref:hypothetical protein n=1 Tax=Streptomyces viridosporus TaxID=67581 RepID=UPI0037011620
MSTFFLAVGLVMALVLGVAGSVALVTGRVALPWLRGSTNRPRLWGVGALLLAGGLAGARLMPFEVDALLVLSGLAFMGASQFFGPRRTQPDRTTTP